MQCATGLRINERRLRRVSVPDKNSTLALNAEIGTEQGDTNGNGTATYRSLG